MLRVLLPSIALGAVLGAGVGLLPRPELGPVVWAVVLAFIGAFLVLAGRWILQQSRDVPKVRAALPLSGAVLASIFCVATGEGFLEPVLACLALGTAISRMLRVDSA